MERLLFGLSSEGLEPRITVKRFQIFVFGDVQARADDKTVLDGLLKVRQCFFAPPLKHAGGSGADGPGEPGMVSAVLLMTALGAALGPG
jgi:hypothetical protein